MSTELLSVTPISHVTPVARPRVTSPLQPLVSATSATPEAEVATADDGAALDKAVAELNRYVAGSRTDLQFAVDQEAGRLVVSIIDAENGQVLRQMPSVEALRIARYLEHDRLGLIRQRA